MDCYYKLRQLFYYKVYYKLRQVLQSAMDLLQIATGITKCDDYYKLRQYTGPYPIELVGRRLLIVKQYTLFKTHVSAWKPICWATHNLSSQVRNRKSAFKQPKAVLIKIRFAFTGFKLSFRMSLIINRIHRAFWNIYLLALFQCLTLTGTHGQRIRSYKKVSIKGKENKQTINRNRKLTFKYSLFNYLVMSISYH